MTATMNEFEKLWLHGRIRDMWHRLEAAGFVALTGPEKTIVILRRPSLREFRATARLAEVPEPRSWEAFYEGTFDNFLSEARTLIQ